MPRKPRKMKTRLYPIAALSTGILAGIGEVVSEFGRIEYETKLAIKNMVGNFKQGLIEAEQKRQFSTIADHAIAKARAQFGVRKAARLVRLINEAKRLSNPRHDVVHGCWFSDDRLVRTKFKKPRSLTQKHLMVREAELRALAEQLRCIRRGIHDERFTISGQKPPEQAAN